MSDKVDESVAQDELKRSRETIEKLDRRLRAVRAARVVNSIFLVAVTTLIVALGVTPMTSGILGGVIGSEISSCVVAWWRDRQLRRELGLEA